jgi:outer membrane protein assembly factor BamB
VRASTIHKRVVAAALVGLLAAAGCSGSGDEDDSTQPPPGDAPAASSVGGGEWLYAKGDQFATRTAHDSRIDSSTVESLEVAWTYEVEPIQPNGAFATAPLVVDGVVWIEDLLSNVYGLDLATGEEISLIRNDRFNYGPNGVAVDSGTIFAGVGGQSINAYDLATEEVIWENRLVDLTPGNINMQPVVADGKVFASTTSLGGSGSRGTLYALDPDTGDVIWSFDTIESVDLWGQPEVNGGGGSWYPPAIDVEAGTVYWGTSNPYPWPGTEGFANASSRPGDNRWTNSTLALDIDSGELQWGFQHRPHDLFDLDTQLAAVATYEDGDGETDKVVVISGKFGRVRGMDPESGEMLWDTPVGIHENDDLQEFEGSLQVYPGNVGGVTTPLAVSDGVAYVAMVNAPTFLESPDTDFTLGGPDLSVDPGQIVAIDVSDGSILWDVETDGPTFGGTTVVNDLVFGSVLSGEIFALDRDTGEVVWSDQLPAGTNGWPAIVEDTIIVPAGLGSDENPPAVVAYRLPT